MWLENNPAFLAAPLLCRQKLKSNAAETVHIIIARAFLNDVLPERFIVDGRYIVQLQFAAVSDVLR